MASPQVRQFDNPVNFKALYVDRAGIYVGSKRCYFSQVQRACEEMNIQIIYAHSPEAKERIECAFGTLKDRLIPKLRSAEIKDIRPLINSSGTNHPSLCKQATQRGVVVRELVNKVEKECQF